MAVGGGVLYRFVYGKYTTRNNTTTSGEGETYLTPDEHIELAINAAEKKGKKDIRARKKRNGFDITYEDEDGHKTGISVRKKED